MSFRLKYTVDFTKMPSHAFVPARALNASTATASPPAVQPPLRISALARARQRTALPAIPSWGGFVFLPLAVSIRARTQPGTDTTGICTVPVASMCN